jgi:hypothetical protein
MLNTAPDKLLRPVHLLSAGVLFCLLFLLSYPFYRYFVDPDAVAYLTMAKRAAAGEPWRLVNALWSPLHPALVAACIHFGMDGLLAAQLTNAIACLLALAAGFAIFRRFGIGRPIGFPLLLALAGFLCYALYKQLFCDLWQLAFLLWYLIAITTSGFLKKPGLWALAGLLMAAAAYAKIYSFYFLLLHFPVSVWVLSRQAKRSFSWKAFSAGLLTMAMLLSPLSLLMHAKYGFWSLSKSGALNTSWTLVGHKTLRSDIGALIPPPYPNSPYTWEDPFIAEGALHSRFESLAMLKSQVGHSIQSALQGVEAAGQISPLLLLIFAATAFALLLRRGSFSSEEKIVFAAAAIMPLGYLLLHVEARYIWLLLPLGMLFGARWLQQLAPFFSGRQWLFRLAAWTLAASFVVYPLYDMKSLFRGGEDIYRLAQKLCARGLVGSFTSDAHPSRMGLLAYWLDANYYTPSAVSLSREAILADARRYELQYYFHFANGLDATTPVLLDEQGKPFPRLDGGRPGQLSVFLLTRPDTAPGAH